MVEKFVDKDAKKGNFNSRMRFCKRSNIFPLPKKEEIDYDSVQHKCTFTYESHEPG
jgi:hypothetical protein